MPVDPYVLNTGIASRSGAFPILEPQEMAGAGIVRQRSVLPGVEDATWEYSRETRKLRRLPIAELSDAFGVASDGSAGVSAGGAGGATTYASTWDPDSANGFSARIQDFNYRLLGEQATLASVDGSSPATPCEQDGGRSVCPENWQVRRVYVIEATAKPRSVGGNVIVPRRVLYIDAEGWFITASDLYDHNGNMWKTIANFHAYSDRSTPNANVSIWPFKRIFQTAMVEEDVTDGFSTVVYTPGLNSHNGVYVNMGAVDRDFFTPAQMVQSSR